MKVNNVISVVVVLIVVAMATTTEAREIWGKKVEISKIKSPQIEGVPIENVKIRLLDRKGNLIRATVTANLDGFINPETIMLRSGYWQGSVTLFWLYRWQDRAGLATETSINVAVPELGLGTTSNRFQMLDYCSNINIDISDAVRAGIKAGYPWQGTITITAGTDSKNSAAIIPPGSKLYFALLYWGKYIEEGIVHTYRNPIHILRPIKRLELSGEKVIHKQITVSNSIHYRLQVILEDPAQRWIMGESDPFQVEKVLIIK